MRQLRLSGPGTGSDKYDLLTALSVAALAQGGQMQVSLLRLMSLITARYNWAQDELSLGQREMAQMWAVDERTAKREVKRLLDLGVLILMRKGVKGRVASYRLSFTTICAMTEKDWSRVGSDFAERMSERHHPKPEETKVLRVDFAAKQQPQAPAGDDPWSRAMQRLEVSDPARYKAWFAALTPRELNASLLEIQAPSQFVAQYVATHFQRLVEAALRHEYGADLRCIIRG